MGLRIGTNVAAISAQRSLSQNERQSTHASRALSSGNRIVSSGDDSAGFAISESLRAQASSLKQARENAENGAGLIQVAEGGLNEQNNILVRLRELAVQSASDTVGDDERGYLNTEYTSLVSEFDRIAKTTTYGRQPLLSGSNKDYEFHVGANNTDSDVIKYRLDTNTTSDSVGISGSGVSDKSDARSALESIDEAQTFVAKARSSVGSIQERLHFASANLETQRDNVMEAHSRIADADIAEETSNLTSAKLLQDVGTSVLAQANMNPQRALRLLG